MRSCRTKSHFGFQESSRCTLVGSWQCQALKPFQGAANWRYLVASKRDCVFHQSGTKLQIILSMTDSCKKQLALNLIPGERRMRMRNEQIKRVEEMVDRIHLVGSSPFWAILSGVKGSGKSLVRHIA